MTDSSTSVNLGDLIRKYYRTALSSIFESIRSSKALVLDQDLTESLGLIAEFKFFTDLGIEKVYHLSPGSLDTNCSNLIYFTPPSAQNMRSIAEHVRNHQQAGQIKSYHVYFVPRRDFGCENLLEQLGVLGDLSLSVFDFDLVPLEYDVLSLEQPNWLEQLGIDEDLTVLGDLSNSLIKLRKLIGPFKHIYGKGKCAKITADLLRELEQNEKMNEDLFIGGESLGGFDSVYIFDRNVDYISVLLSQLTYEGLIDDSIGIKKNTIELGTNATQSPGKYQLSSLSDPLYEELRNLNFSAVGEKLNKMAKRINHDYSERHQAQTVSQLKSFVGRLGGIQQQKNALKLHVEIADYLTKDYLTEKFYQELEIQQQIVSGEDDPSCLEHLERLIWDQKSPTQVLRYMSLYCQVYGGFRKKVWENLKSSFFQTFGYHHFITFEAMEKLGLIHSGVPSSSFKQNYSSLQNQLKLSYDSVDDNSPNDLSYVFSGAFSPIIPRIVEHAEQNRQFNIYASQKNRTKNGDKPKKPQKLKNIWDGIEEALSLLPGDTFDQSPREGGSQIENIKIPTKQTVKSGTNSLIIFIGGCSFSEISAIRYMSHNSINLSDRNFTILTSSIWNANRLLSTLLKHVKLDKLPVLITEE